MRSLRVTAKRVQWSASPGYHIGNSAGTPTAIFIRVDEPQDHGNSMMKLAAKGSRRNKFTFWRERRAGRCEAPRRRRCRTSSRSGNEADTRPSLRAPAGCGPQARWLCCSLLTYRAGYSSSLAPRQRAWGPAAKCEFISARALRQLFGPTHKSVAGPGRARDLKALSRSCYVLATSQTPGFGKKNLDHADSRPAGLFPSFGGSIRLRSGEGALSGGLFPPGQGVRDTRRLFGCGEDLSGGRGELSPAARNPETARPHLSDRAEISGVHRHLPESAAGSATVS